MANHVQVNGLHLLPLTLILATQFNSEHGKVPSADDDLTGDRVNSGSQGNAVIHVRRRTEEHSEDGLKDLGGGIAVNLGHPVSENLLPEHT